LAVISDVQKSPLRLKYAYCSLMFEAFALVTLRLSFTETSPEGRV
jgi:hypothetical protein